MSIPVGGYVSYYIDVGGPADCDDAASTVVVHQTFDFDPGAVLTSRDPDGGVGRRVGLVPPSSNHWARNVVDCTAGPHCCRQQ